MFLNVVQRRPLEDSQPQAIMTPLWLAVRAVEWMEASSWSADGFLSECIGRRCNMARCFLYRNGACNPLRVCPSLIGRLCWNELWVFIDAAWYAVRGTKAHLRNGGTTSCGSRWVLYTELEEMFAQLEYTEKSREISKYIGEFSWFWQKEGWFGIGTDIMIWREAT